MIGGRYGPSALVGAEITMTTIQDVELKIKAVEFALGTFADHRNDEEARQAYLRSDFNPLPHLKTYFSYSENALVNLLEQLQGEIWQLRQLQSQQLQLQLELQKQFKTAATTVRICIGDIVQDVRITFSNLKAPLDTVKEAVLGQGLLKRGKSLDSYTLVTIKSALVANFAALEGEKMLLFQQKTVPLSSHEWTDVQLDQLKVRFRDVDLGTFFSDSALTSLQMSERGEALAELLAELDKTLDQKYTSSPDVDASDAICTISPMLQNPICKALFAAKKCKYEYKSHESFVDDFVKHLLNAMGFNDGRLYAAPQLRINLHFGETVKSATADVTVIDLLSYASIGVVEDKYWREMMMFKDSTAQLVAEGIAIAQYNEAVRGQKRDAVKGQKRDAEGNPKAASESFTCSETVYGIRVTLSRFHFYAIRVSPQIHGALQHHVIATEPTIIYRYKSDDGLDFMVKKERDEIILMVSLLQEVAKKTGET
eukprot:gene15653-11202_t